jgi:undecaprenyl diphosphate synthase
MITAPPSADRRLPRHVGIIMDGNGRWAEKRGLPRIEGHRVGADSVRDVVRASRELGIQALTLYAFSAQNWARPADEVRALMLLLRDYLIEERPEIMDNDIRLRAIGEVDRLPALVREPLDALVADSAGNQHMVLNLALSYDGRASIVAAARRAAEAAVAGTLDPARLTVAQFGQLMATSELPELDLLIRTSGERRISNFMLWELAYAELHFSDTLWPDFRREQLYLAIDDFGKRERRFGMTGQQVAAVGSDLVPDPNEADPPDDPPPDGPTEQDT